MTVPDLSCVKIEVVCPSCGEIYNRTVERAFAESKTARRISGYLPIYCNDCKQEINNNKEVLDNAKR